MARLRRRSGMSAPSREILRYFTDDHERLLGSDVIVASINYRIVSIAPRNETMCLSSCGADNIMLRLRCTFLPSHVRILSLQQLALLAE